MAHISIWQEYYKTSQRRPLEAGQRSWGSEETLRKGAAESPLVGQAAPGVQGHALHTQEGSSGPCRLRQGSKRGVKPALPLGSPPTPGDRSESSLPHTPPQSGLWPSPHGRCGPVSPETHLDLELPAGTSLQARTSRHLEMEALGLPGAWRGRAAGGPPVLF